MAQMQEESGLAAERARRLFVDTPPLRLFLVAAVPGAASMLASALYNLADGIFVGQLLGQQAFAAVNLAMPFVILNFAFGDMIGVGSSVPISISMGRGDDERANNIFSCSVLLNVLLGAVTGAALFFAAPAIMAAMGATGELASMAVDFLRVYAAFSPITVGMFAVDNYLKACGRIRSSLALNVFMAVFGGVVEFSLMYFLHLGILGAALGYALAMAVCTVLALLPFALGRMQLRFVRPRLSWALVREIAASGMPTFLNNVAGRVTSIALNAALLLLGGEYAVSAYGLLMYVDGFVFPLIYGVCDSLQPSVGYNWGARRQDRVVAIERCVFAACAAISLASGVAMALLPRELTLLFISDPAPELTALATVAFRVFAVSFTVRWFPFATQALMTAIQMSKLASLLSVCSALVFPLLELPLLWPLGLTGLWLNYPVMSFLSLVLSLWVLLAFRRELRLEAA